MQTMILQRYRLTKSGITIYGKEGSEGKRNMNMNMKIGANREERFKGIIETRAAGAFGSIGFHSAGTENAAAGTAGGFAAAWAASEYVKRSNRPSLWGSVKFLRQQQQLLLLQSCFKRYENEID